MSRPGFTDGLEGGAGLDDGDEIDLPGVSIRTSRNAGNYYCAHAFYVLARWCEREPGALGAGFLHVPPDAETSGEGSAGPDRHERLGTVVAAALRGLLEEHSGPRLRVLLTGYGAFQGVLDNPTGAFVAAKEAVARTLERAAGARAESETDGSGIVVWRAGRLELGTLLLDVSDAALDPTRPGSLPWALVTFAPHVALSMGVHRTSDVFRVELLPTSAGLVWDGERGRHVADAGPTDVRREEPLLARAIERGARSLAVGKTPVG